MAEEARATSGVGQQVHAQPQSGSTGPTPSPAGSSFEAALAFVLRMEGGESNDPDDAGGHTRFGIAQASHPQVNVATLTLDTAKAIYRADYWDPLAGDLLPPRLAFVVFDCAVNQGTRTAAGLLQQALGVEMDGRVGQRTIAAAIRAGDAVIPRFLRLRALRYFDLVRSKPVQQKFLAGWIERCFRVQQAALGVSA